MTEDHRVWAAYDELLRRVLVLEEIADRLAATSADPVAVADYRTWKEVPMSIVPKIEATPPIIGLGSSTVVTPVVRTGLQALSPALLLGGLRVFHVWEPDPDQVAWLMSAGTIIFAAVQNAIEQWRGRKLLGRS